MSKIILENMEFHAKHGVLSHEKHYGNTFIVNLELEVNMDIAQISDRLEDTLNYQQLYDIIADQMEKPSNLLEHAAHITAARLMNHFPAINCLKIRVSKLNPPLGGKVGSVSVEKEMKRLTM